MKINIVLGPFLSIPPAPCGAVERVWHDLAGEFARRNHEVRLLYKEHKEVTPSSRDIELIPIRGFESTGSTMRNLPLDFLYSARVMRRIPKADVTVTNTFFLPMLLPKLCRKAGKIHAHIARMPKGQIKMYSRLGTHRLLAVSQAVATAIVREAPQAGQLTRVISYPIRNDVFHPTGEKESSPSPKTILYAGRIHPEKGILLLVDALRILHNKGLADNLAVKAIGPWRIDQGGGGEPYRREILKRAEGLSLQLEEPIFEREAFADALRSATIFCYPSLAEKGETFGVAPLEAMACGTPVVLSNLMVFRDFFEPGKHGEVFDHHDSEPAVKLADAIAGLLSRSTDEMVATSRACAERGREFGLSVTAERYLEDFSELTGLNP
ncbi:MAG: glycosyltransferase family 4 protein [Candidatus Sumerlaeia bacterium]|nr:glycosyltransferase family 4 protein [Candidatus Sumerlaeia bacterium]